MRTFKMQKLVRDKIVENIQKKGNKVDSRILDDEQFIKELKIKLKEELDELNEVDISNKDSLKNELADIQLIVDYLLKAINLSKQELDKFQNLKLTKAGGFDKRIFVETVSLRDDDEWVEYYRKNGFEEIK